MNKQPRRISGERFTLHEGKFPTVSPPGSEHWPVAEDDTRGPLGRPATAVRVGVPAPVEPGPAEPK